jgi:hypothetical protein
MVTNKITRYSPIIPFTDNMDPFTDRFFKWCVMFYQGLINRYLKINRV